MSKKKTPEEETLLVPQPAGQPMDPPPPLAATGGPSPESMILIAIERGVSVETLERLLALRDRLRAEEARNAFFGALSEMQAEMPTIQKSKEVKGERFEYRYAPLEDIVEQVKPYLRAHGFSYQIKTRQSEGSLTAICELHHEAGHMEPTELTVPIDMRARMNDTQKVGSAMTYSKRYVFCNAVGVLTADTDDDGRGNKPSKEELDSRPNPFGEPPVKAHAKPASPEGVAEIDHPVDEDMAAAERAAEILQKAAVDRATAPESPAATAPLDQVPPPHVGRLSPRQNALLHASLGELAKAGFADSPEAARLRLKAKVKQTWDLDHLTDLSPSQFEVVMGWVGQAKESVR